MLEAGSAVCIERILSIHTEFGSFGKQTLREGVGSSGLLGRWNEGDGGEKGVSKKEKP